MANKRDYELDDTTSFDNTFSIKVDKLGLGESQKVLPSNIVTKGLGLALSGVLTVPLATVVPNYVKYYEIGDAVSFSFDFDVDFSATDPVFTLDVIPNGGLSSGQLMNCTVDGVLTRCELTGITPTTFTVFGTFGSGSTRTFKINGIAL